jgi:hypothetical protein
MTPTTKGISIVDFTENPARFHFIAASGFYLNEPARDMDLSLLTYGGEDCDTPTFALTQQELEFRKTVIEGKLLIKACSARVTSFLISRIKGVQEGDTYGTIIEQDEIELLRSFAEGRTVSRPVVVPLSHEAESFCNRQDIRKYVTVASDLINQCFSNIRGVDSEILQDPDAEDQFLVIHLEVKGEIEAVLDMYDKYTEEWVSRVPWPERGKIGLSYIVV